MTMPTSFPRSFPEVRFPWEFTELYDKPIRWFGESSRGMGIGAPFDGITVNTLYHKNKYEDSLRHVQERVLGNRRRQISQETGQANRRLNRVLDRGLEGGCMSCEPDWSGGAFRNGHMNMMSPSTIEGANVLAGRGHMKGGTMRTQAGAQWIRSRLTSRIAELDTADGDVNGVGAENPLDTQEMDEDDELLMDLGEFLDNILENVSTGYFDGNSISAARGFLKSLLSGGWQVPSNQLVILQRNLDGVVEELTSALGNKAPTYALSAEKKKIVRTMLTTMERARTTVEQLVKNSYLAPNERKMVLGAYKPKLKQQLASQVESQIPNRLRGYRNEGEVVADDLVDDGAFNRTYAVAQRPAWYVNLSAIPGKVRLPRMVAEKIARS